MGGGVDGYPTILKLDGKTLPEHGLPREYWEKIIHVELTSDFKVEVEVETLEYSVLFLPENFTMDLGDFRVSAELGSCRVTLNGYEPKCLKFSVSFEEGCVPAVNLQLIPSVQVADTPEIR